MGSFLLPALVLQQRLVHVRLSVNLLHVRDERVAILGQQLELLGHIRTQAAAQTSEIRRQDNLATVDKILDQGLDGDGLVVLGIRFSILVSGLEENGVGVSKNIWARKSSLLVVLSCREANARACDKQRNTYDLQQEVN